MRTLACSLLLFGSIEDAVVLAPRSFLLLGVLVDVLLRQLGERSRFTISPTLISRILAARDAAENLAGAVACRRQIHQGHRADVHPAPTVVRTKRDTPTFSPARLDAQHQPRERLVEVLDTLARRLQRLHPPRGKGFFRHLSWTPDLKSAGRLGEQAGSRMHGTGCKPPNTAAQPKTCK